MGLLADDIVPATLQHRSTVIKLRLPAADAHQRRYVHETARACSLRQRTYMFQKETMHGPTFSRAPIVAGRVICDASSTMQTSKTRRASIALLVLRHVHATWDARARNDCLQPNSMM